jgi:multiple sugar transport system ATP-binding protein
MAELRFEGATRVYPGSEVAALHSLDLDIADGELMVLVGPSGSGKTTALRMLAGLEEVDAGTIWIGDRDATYDLPRDRDVAMVFQNYALYPYLDVAANIAFPLKMARVPKAERERRVRDAAEMLELTEYLKRKPAQLSGGQRQRVAMGRAVVRQPKAFLMDEPLSNLDAKLRVQMRADIAALQERLGVTTVYVTHDQVEAMTLGHRIAVLRDGQLQQCDEPRAVYERPANVFVAGFIGSPAMNLVEAPISDGACELNGVRLELPGAVAGAAGALGRVVLGLRPESLEPGSTGLSARVEVVEELGSEAYALCSAELPQGEQRLIARVDSRRPPERGERLTLQPRAEELHVFDPESGRRLGS